ncbi:MAG: hypothetical protein IT233_13950 [Bacteroidia bacterium]|nr:hypothetical protein [Bacteroidia bacterium]
MINLKQMFGKILLGICLSFNATGQNLVYNGGFEINNDCINTYLDNADQWRLIGTPDFYDTCMPVMSFSNHIPDNWCGNQPARTGNAYGGNSAQIDPYIPL